MVNKRLHIGIILDGNRRFAKKLSMRPWEGHSVGAEKVKELIGWCKEFDIAELTLYSFSIENFNRPQKEKEILFDLFRENIDRVTNDKKFSDEDIRLRFVGRLELFPKDLLDKMNEIMKMTLHKKTYTINFAMGYGGRAEIVDATKKIVEDAINGKIDTQDVTEEMITSHLYLTSEPDMIIRPGGEKRVSNFLIWQSYYSEWYFTDKLWPEFTKEDFAKSLEEFKQRERRFGR